MLSTRVCRPRAQVCRFDEHRDVLTGTRSFCDGRGFHGK
jgi:hypothetical protein